LILSIQPGTFAVKSWAGSIGHIIAENTMMKRVSEGVGFHLHFNGSANAWLAEMNL
jgi:hypothetical protein